MKQQKEIRIFDNIISLKEQNKLVDLFLGNNFPWFYISDITDPVSKKQNRHALSHNFINNGKLNSNHFTNIEHIIKNTCLALNYQNVKTTNVRSFLQFPLNMKHTKLDTPHIDTTQNHKVFLYYVTDNDAQTIIYKGKNSTKIKPKKGRLVVFDGSLYHTAEQPKKNIRCVINCNIVSYEEGNLN